MPNENTSAEDKLRKLGQRIRDGWAKKHPTSEKQLQTIRGVIREEWEKEQKEKRRRATRQDPTKDREAEPPEPGDER